MDAGLKKSIEEGLKSIRHVNTDEEDLVCLIIDIAHEYYKLFSQRK
jgi:hypothetical protein